MSKSAKLMIRSLKKLAWSDLLGWWMEISSIVVIKGFVTEKETLDDLCLDVIVMCASEKYQKSKNCKNEAKFAYENDKPVVPVMMENFQREKWLRFIMGTKLYIPFYEGMLQFTSFFLCMIGPKELYDNGQVFFCEIRKSLLILGRSLGTNDR